MARPSRVLCLLLAAALAAGCGDGSGPSNPPRKQQPLRLSEFRFGDEPAPEAAGKDATGETFKLSDYKGKVVLLDFWGSWCGPCLMMIPHERALVRDYKDKPFALLGVNSDHSFEEFQQAQKKYELNWRSLWDGDRSVARTWGVNSWPTVFLIDHEGIVRYKFGGVPRDGPELLDVTMRAAIDELLKEVPEQ